MKDAWNSYKEALFSKMPSLRATLGAGVSKAEIKAVEDKMGITFPADLRTLYLKNNGDNGEKWCGMILGYHFLPLDELYYQWEGWRDIINEWTPEEIENRSVNSSVPVGCIKQRYADLKWIPICEDGSGNHIGVDLAPDVNGKMGQVINFGRDEDDKHVLADSLKTFFERLTRIVNSDDFFIGEIEDEEVIFLGENNEEEGSCLIDYLKDEDSVK